MKFQLFKPRSALRDRATDVARSERLIGLLTSLIRECTLEEEGLLKRYESAQQNASWAVHRLEAEGGARELNAMIDSYEAAMRYCEKRVESLQRDKRLLASLHEALDRHRANSDFTDGSPPA